MSNIRFIPVAELTEPLTVSLGLSGGSGTGKTYSALLVARGIAEGMTGKPGAPFGVVDTENRRALHYRDAFPEMMHFDFRAVDDAGKMLGFPPERWIEVIDAAEAANLPALVIDSFSHAWEGVGGVLDLQAQELDRLTGGNAALADKRSQLAWAAVKPRYRRLIDRIVRAKTNIIICTRAKPVMQDFKTRKNARPTKTRRFDVPWDPASDGDLMFEMTAMAILSPDAPGCPVYQIKVADQFRAVFDASRPLSVETGRALAEWAKGQGDAQRQKELLDHARNQARQGSAAFRAWWGTLDAGSRGIVKTIMDECKALASDADAAATASDEEPFGITYTLDGETYETLADWLAEATATPWSAARIEAHADLLDAMEAAGGPDRYAAREIRNMMENPND